MTQRLFVMPCSSDVLTAIGQLEPALGARARAFGFRMPAGRFELGDLVRAPAGALLLEGGARARGGARRGARKCAPPAPPPFRGARRRRASAGAPRGAASSACSRRRG